MISSDMISNPYKSNEINKSLRIENINWRSVNLIPNARFKNFPSSPVNCSRKAEYP
jgi:hypothetical protein